jgi:L-ascorbate metabolism protein UlaG (beta-lactamase superfamily)
MMPKVFGQNPSGERLARLQRSSNYRNGSFQNLSTTPVMAEDSSFWKTLRAWANKSKESKPGQPVPSVRTDLKTLPDGAPVIVWFGHSSYLLKVNGLHILVDPVFSGYAAPFSFMVKAYPGSNVYTVADLPPIDILLQTHDHYDHLDYGVIRSLRSSVKKVVTTLGTGSHFEYWGYDKNIITELDWWETTNLSGLQLTATPGRHFSGRGLSRGKTLWAGFALGTGEHRLFLGGDSGYDSHFAEIGNKFGSFDLALLECGQYNQNWPYIHMMPEQTAQAAIELKTKRLMPVHWAKFTLSLHAWNEPIKRLTAKANELGLPLTTPRIGEPVIVGEQYPEERWWEE